jgi:hypothetical protein
MDEGATAALLDDAAGRPVDADVAALIHERSGGNPLFALELYRHLLAEKAIPGDAADVADDKDDGEVEAAPAGLPLLTELPASLVDVVAWRLAHLPGDARTALESVACSPDGATAQLVAATLGASRSRAVQLLELSVIALAAELVFLFLVADVSLVFLLRFRLIGVRGCGFGFHLKASNLLRRLARYRARCAKR